VGLIGFAFVTGWVFGREYSDRTVKDLLALPTPRLSIVLSKFIVVAIWRGGVMLINTRFSTTILDCQINYFILKDILKFYANYTKNK